MIAVSSFLIRPSRQSRTAFITTGTSSTSPPPRMPVISSAALSTGLIAPAVVVDDLARVQAALRLLSLVSFSLVMCYVLPIRGEQEDSEQQRHDSAAARPGDPLIEHHHHLRGGQGHQRGDLQDQPDPLDR